MKKRIAFLLSLTILASAIVAIPMSMSGYYEGKIILLNDEMKDMPWYRQNQFNDEYDEWQRKYYLDTKFWSSPIANSDMYFRLYAENNKTEYSGTARLGEAHVSYQYDRKGYGIKSILFTRENGNYWTDGSMLKLLDVDNVKNDDNGQGVRFDAWYPFKGSFTYVLSDFSGGNGDDIHLFRYRQQISDKINTGVFYQRKNYPDAMSDSFNDVTAVDMHIGLGRYFFNSEFAWSRAPSDPEIKQINDKFSDTEDILKTNVALMSEFTGVKFGTSKLGYVLVTPGVWSIGRTFYNEMMKTDDDQCKQNRYGFWLNNKYLIPNRAITLTVKYIYWQKHLPDTIEVVTITDQGFESHEKKAYDATTNLYSELYVEFVNGFKGKLFFNKKDEKYRDVLYKHYDFFTEVSVENRLAKLLAQFKIVDIGEENEKILNGIELSFNLTDRLRFFMRGLILNEEEGSRHSIFGELKYSVSGNSELYIQYGPGFWGQDGLVNDDDFKNRGYMIEGWKLILKGWF